MQIRFFEDVTTVRRIPETGVFEKTSSVRVGKIVVCACRECEADTDDTDRCDDCGTCPVCCRCMPGEG